MVSDDRHLVSRLRKRQSKVLKGLISPTSKNGYFFTTNFALMIEISQEWNYSS